MIKFRKFIIRTRTRMLSLRNYYFRWLGMDIDKNARISISAKLDFTYPIGIHIGRYSYVGGGCLILSHDFTRHIHTDTWIGEYCFIGMNAIVLPGIKIGNHCIIGAGSVVTKDVPSNTIVAGNPAKLLRVNINTKEYGQLLKEEMTSVE